MLDDAFATYTRLNDAVMADLEELRRDADTAIAAGGFRPLGPLNGEKYPVGFCKPIRDFALGRLSRQAAEDQGRAAFAAIDAVRRAGGVVKGIWGVQKGVYFQNAIQVGDLWVDMANDTVDVKRPPVEVCPLAEARFEEITSFDQYARVAKTYWDQEAYPNHVFPGLAAVLPVIVVSDGGAPRIAAPKTLVPRNVRLDFALSHRFLTAGAFARRTLPAAVVARLARNVRDRAGGAAGGDAALTGFEPSAPLDAAAAIAGERAVRAHLSDDAYAARFFAILRAAAAVIR